MAYGKYKIFEFNSINGIPFEIDILKKDYTGYPSVGILGGSPLLRRDNNDRICGTSLEFPVQSNVDGDLVEFYTSDFSQYRVELKQNNRLIFVGYLLPELYSEPDIAPPYDVTFTAVDGLGELKRQDFYGGTNWSIDDTLKYILSSTGLDLQRYYFSGLACKDLETVYGVDKWAVFSKIQYDFRNLDGKSRYDALQKILETFNSYMYQSPSGWLFINYSDINMDDGEIYFETADRSNDIYVVPEVLDCIDSIYRCPWYPYGHLTTTIVPAKSSVRIVADDTYRDSLLEDSTFNKDVYDSAWYKFKDIGYYNYKNRKCWQLDYMGEIWQEVPFKRAIDVPVDICVKVICHAFWGRPTNPLHLHLIVSVKTSNGGTTYYFKGSDSDKEAGFTTKSSSNNYIDIVVDGKNYREPKEVTITLPFEKLGPRVSSIYVKAVYDEIEPTTVPESNYKEYPVLVELSVKPKSKSKGFNLDLLFNNGAREKAKEVNSLVPMEDTRYRIHGSDAVYGVPFFGTGGNVKEDFKKRIQTLSNFYTMKKSQPREFVSCLADSIAMEEGLPRLRLEGCLHVPAQREHNEVGMPIALMKVTTSNLWFVPETMDWSLAESELDISMISIPSAIVTASETNRTVIED